MPWLSVTPVWAPPIKLGLVIDTVAPGTTAPRAVA